MQKPIQLTVKELIEKLKEFPADAKVYFNDDGYMASPVGMVVDIGGKDSCHAKDNLTGVLLDWAYEEIIEQEKL